MTEKILYYDCFCGISGDMNLAALVDAGVPEDYLRKELARLPVEGWKLTFAAAERKSVRGLRAEVDVEPPVPRTGSLARTAEHIRHREHEHRSFRDISRMIESSSLSGPVKKRSLDIFGRIAAAEAKVHGRAIEDVEFHEVGAVDSIIDIVGAAICLDYLKPDRILASAVELGGGFVKCAHGTFPVPAPATAEILKGIPIKSGAVRFEATTPTGAAILAASVDEFTEDKRFTVARTAYGVGRRDAEIPNVLRVFIADGPAKPASANPLKVSIVADTAAAPADGEAAPVPSGASGNDCVLECNVDDMNPELYGYLSDTLFAAGAADVWFTPIVMKKSRPAVKLSVLCGGEARSVIASILLRETTTFGIRTVSVEKTALEREFRVYATKFGKVHAKLGFLDGKFLKWKPEYEDCRSIAERKGISLLDAYEAVRKAISKKVDAEFDGKKK